MMMMFEKKWQRPRVNAIAVGLLTGLLTSVSFAQAAPLEGYTQGLPKQKQQQVKLTPQALQNGSEDETPVGP